MSEIEQKPAHDKPRSGLLASRLSSRSIVYLCLTASLIACLSALAGLTHGLSDALFDFTLRSRVAPEGFDETVVVQITDEDVEARDKQFPWPRGEQAEIFEAIAAREPAVVAADLLYSEASEPLHDIVLANQIGQAKKSVGAFYFRSRGATVIPDAPQPPNISPDQRDLLENSGDLMGADLKSEGWQRGGHPVLPTAPVAKAFHRLGNIDISEGGGSIVRKIPLVVCDGDRFYPSLALQAVLLYLDASWSQVRLQRGRLTITNLGSRGTIQIPLDRQGRMLVPFHRNSVAQIQGVSVTQLVRENLAPEMKDKIVLVGAAVTGAGDLHGTPVDPSMLGMHIHAIAIRGILEGDFISEVPWWGVLLSILAVAIAAVFAVDRFGVWRGGAVVLFLAPLIVVAPVLLLLMSGHWIPPAAPLLSCLMAGTLAVLSKYSASERRRRDLRQRFGRFFGPAMSDRMIEIADGPKLAGERREITVFFSDVVGFTQKTEELEPEELLFVLNSQFEAAMRVAFRHGGTVNQLMGDGLMVFFNDPVPQDDHCERAVAMAVEIGEAMAELRVELEGDGRPQVEVTMGIAAGYATVGLVGSDEFSTYTAIGRAVNLAARLCDQAAPGEILVNSRAYHLAKGEFDFEAFGELSLKGIAAPVEVFRVVDGGTSPNAAN